MSKKIIILNGSPRESGNTAALTADWDDPLKIEKGLKNVRGHFLAPFFI